MKEIYTCSECGTQFDLWSSAFCLVHPCKDGDYKICQTKNNMKKKNLLKNCSENWLREAQKLSEIYELEKPKEEVRKFSSGAIRDLEDNKFDFIETVSWTAFDRFAGYMTGKKKKYGSGNFKKGIDIESYERSLLRHISKYLRNKYENGNDEKEEDHLSAMVFNIFGIMHEENRHD